MVTKHLVAFATGTVVLAGAGWDLWSFHRQDHVRVTTAAVTSGAIVRRIVATGTLQTVRTVQVGSQVSGTIQSLRADYNSIVHKGDVLATLDPAEYTAELRQAEAALAQAEANLLGFDVQIEDAQTKLTRAEQLAARQLIAPSDLDAARIALAQANADRSGGVAQVNEAQAEVVQAKVTLSHTVINSPIDGIIVARNVDVGQTVAATVEAPVLFAIASDLHHMQVEVDIDEGDIDGVRAGERATFQVDAYPGDLFEGRVATVRVQPVADQTTTATVVGTGPAGQTTSTIATVVSYATMIDVGNDDERLRPGMTATVTLDGSRRGEVVRIPNPALSFQPPSEVLDATGQIADVPPMLQAEAADRRVWQYDGRRFTPLPVRTGLTDGQWTELLAGAIEPGQLVVMSASLTDAP